MRKSFWYLFTDRRDCIHILIIQGYKLDSIIHIQTHIDTKICSHAIYTVKTKKIKDYKNKNVLKYKYIETD